MICYTDTAEFFSQAVAIPNVDSYGESLSCFSYACTAEGTSNGRCQTPLSHGWELTSACKARSDNPAFTDVQCCGGNGCNAPTDTKLWNYVGPADNTAHLSCYFNGLTGLNPNEAYSVVYGAWSGAAETPREAACLRYQQKNSRTCAPLDAWTYSAIDLAACNLKTGKPIGTTYNSVAVESTVMCCAEPDCNAPTPKLDTLTKTGPTITQALLQQDPSFDVSTIKRVYKGIPAEDSEVVPLPRVIRTSTNGNTGVAGIADANEAANNMLEYQLLQSGVMPMGAEGYAGSYGGYGADSSVGMYGSQVIVNASPAPATSAGDNNEAGTLEDGQYPTPSSLGTSSSSAGTASPAATAASSTKTSGAGAVQASFTVVALLAATAAALAMH
ncbi:hypothetical protein OEZ86_013368 [Tetradesmus obliquus]|nr:hypothetical protein OEZ86_013368 [Tetradesmus obliquus]